ncbi:hypothetical protein COT75_05470 [Candidatus Beckwithbacteria bacterium CG10_big_fil_rev_8_21_14_0_10_34_10]|uniref:Uncharacterized protein n=1 Tax=Candidatus Beckwithbacteria bacterium CG10_big_fil_rev_8_21_14_0_10_34_10 TaxID=1974495 RepID=A0A2H0W7R9_9BACT|nr:MAG: hypothetical protein COT75_05470 [Candidatus Beckwithbacteria bacterium CG10_big_fil_rev_8_21_14_0_10_34_10]
MTDSEPGEIPIKRSLTPEKRSREGFLEPDQAIFAQKPFSLILDKFANKYSFFLDLPQYQERTLKLASDDSKEELKALGQRQLILISHHCTPRTDLRIKEVEKIVFRAVNPFIRETDGLISDYDKVFKILQDQDLAVMREKYQQNWEKNPHFREVMSLGFLKSGHAEEIGRLLIDAFKTAPLWSSYLQYLSHNFPHYWTSDGVIRKVRPDQKPVLDYPHWLEQLVEWPLKAVF